MEKIWKLQNPAPPEFLAQYPELPTLVADLLYHRQLLTPEQIDEFLNPDYLHHVHDPFQFNQMEKAVDRIFLAIEQKQKITIHGDYDADGVCASVILADTLRALGSNNHDVFLPHREVDGYGLNANTVDLFIHNQVNLIITCDCGIGSTEEIAQAKAKGIDTIVTDHHAIPDQTPEAFAIIHPKMPNEAYPDKGLCGGAVAYKLAQALLRRQKEKKLPLVGTQYSPNAFEKWLLDLVAIASVADMVPLLGETRVLTNFGLVVLNKTGRLGLQKLLLEARLVQEADTGGEKRELDAQTIAFQIAPRINAAGRMDHANAAYQLLTTGDPTEAIDLAFALNNNNTERQKTTDELFREATKQIASQPEQPINFVINHDWPAGIIGLLAGRLKDKYYKPAIVMTENEEEIVGSGRSLEGFNLIQALQTCTDFFKKFGGHPLACGFTLKDKTRREELQQKLNDIFRTETAGQELRPILYIDAQTELEKVDWDLYSLLEKFRPFGQNNERPKYLATDLTIHNLEKVGSDGKHLRLLLRTPRNQIRKAMGWRLGNGNGHNWAQELRVGDRLDIVFELEKNTWNGNDELQITIVDLKKK